MRRQETVDTRGRLVILASRPLVFYALHSRSLKKSSLFLWKSVEPCGILMKTRSFQLAWGWGEYEQTNHRNLDIAGNQRCTTKSWTWRKAHRHSQVSARTKMGFKAGGWIYWLRPSWLSCRHITVLQNYRTAIKRDSKRSIYISWRTPTKHSYFSLYASPNEIF